MGEGNEGGDARGSTSKSGKGGKDDGKDTEGEDSFRWKQQKAIRQLNVILNYAKDFKEITEILKKEKRNNQPLLRQVELEREPVIETVRMEEAPKGGGHGSQGSGSQTNTTNLSRSVQPSAVLTQDA